jgi:dolichyl-phosphate beta-glucosyltransferase
MSGGHDRALPVRGRETNELDTPELSVVVPAFNSARYIGDTVREIVAFFEQSGVRGEVVVVDDGSTDDTYAAAAVSPLAQVLRLDHNRGKGAALRAGMIRARGTVRAFTDADLPYGTRPLASAMHYINERGFHAVVGDRTLPGSTFLSPRRARRIVSDTASFAFRTLVTGGIYDTQCGMKAFRGDVAAELFPMTRVDGFAIDVELIYLLLKYRLDIKRLPVQLHGAAPTSVKVIRDSARAARDIARIRANWAMRRYRSDYLLACLAADLERDGVALDRRVSPPTSARPIDEADVADEHTAPASIVKDDTEGGGAFRNQT